MKTNRPDIAKAAGIVTGAVLLFFVLKFVVIFSGLLALLMLILKRI